MARGKPQQATGLRRPVPTAGQERQAGATSRSDGQDDAEGDGGAAMGRAAMGFRFRPVGFGLLLTVACRFPG